MTGTGAEGRHGQVKVGRTMLGYTVLRFGLAFAAFGVCLLGGLPWPIALVIGFVVSSIASFILLRPQREMLADELIARKAAKDEARAKRRAALDE